MKKKFRLLIALSLLILLFSSCKSGKVGNTKQTNSKDDINITTPKFAIYMVKESENIELDSKNINKFILQKEPIITEKDIISYNWSATNNKLIQNVKTVSYFTLKDGVTIWGRISEQGYKGAGVYPFIATVNDVRIYVGEFYAVSTSMGISKNIYVYSPLNEQEKNKVQLFDTSDKDLIHNKKIYNVFKSSGILKE